MKTRVIISRATIIVAVAFLFGSCQKRDINITTDTVIDNAQADELYGDVFKLINDAQKDQDGMQKNGTPVLHDIMTSCAVITLDDTIPGSFPKTLTIDFGVGCTGSDGKERKGKIIAVFSGRYIDAGTVITISLDGFHVNDHKIEGQKIITNNGYNTAQNPSFTVEVKNGKITLPDGKTIEREAIRTQEWVEGHGSPFNIFDDVYHITGEASGKTIKDVKYEARIVERLRVEIGCRWIVSGKIDITPEDRPTRSVDFGDGHCDNKATVTIKGKVHEIEMK